VLNGNEHLFVGIIDISGEHDTGDDLYKDVDGGKCGYFGNVMLTSGSSASSGSDKGNDGVDNHDPGARWCLAGVWKETVLG
jgi:microcompartment protein CcmK/EutM